MKKIISLLFIVYWLFGPIKILAATDYGSADKSIFVQCFCTYQATYVNPESEYYNPEANLTDFFETSFSFFMSVLDPSKVTIGDKINGCQQEAIRKGLGNAQCFNEKPIQMTELKDEFKFTAPDLKVKIPGFEKFSSPPTIWNKEEGVAYFTWLGEYIKAIYNFGLIAISILAVLMIIVSGIKIIMSGLGGEKKEAYKRITQAIIGLVLAWGSYTILYIINPNLLEFRGLAIKIATPQDIKEIVDNDSDNGEGITVETAAGETCVPLNELYSIKNIVALGNVSYPSLKKDAYDGLVKAVAEAKKRDAELLVTSAYRDIKTQKAIWEQALAKMKSISPKLNEEELIKQTRKYAAPPSCKSPHLTGKAIDVCIKGSSTCTKLKVEYAQTQNMTPEEKADVTKLKEIMKAAGWKNYTAEWWHYEYNCTECPTINRK